ncbi:hypothetical protein D9M69_569030 [compost metagenome]
MRGITVSGGGVCSVRSSMPFSKVCTWMASIGSELPGPPIWAWPNQARSCSPPSGVGVRCQPVKVDSHLPK